MCQLQRLNAMIALQFLCWPTFGFSPAEYCIRILSTILRVTIEVVQV